MKKRDKVFRILFVLAMVCIVCIAVHRKSGISDIQEKSGNSNTQEKSNIVDAQGKSSTQDTQEKNSIPVTDRQEDSWENHLGEIDEDAEIDPENVIQTEDDDVALAISSSDKKYTVFVKKEDCQKLYIYNTEGNKLDQIDVTPNLATEIMNLEWIEPDKVAVWSHVNPSIGCLDIYDVNSLQKLVEKYCSTYSLSNGIDTLVYVESAPHFSSTIGEEKILNIDDEILYQTEKNEVISSIDNNNNGDIAIVVDKENDNYETQSTDLVVLNKKGKKYKVKEKTGLNTREGREINWINNKKISYSTRKEGGSKVKKITK